MSETTSSKVFMLPDSSNSPLEMAALLNNQNSWTNNPFIYLVWMMMFRNGFWGNENGQVNDVSRQVATLADTVNTNHNNDLVMSALQGNGSALHELAGNLNVGVTALSSAINNIQSAVQTIGAQNGIGQERVINSVLLGNKDLIQQIASCCCENKQLVTTMGYEGQLRDQANTAVITNRIGDVSNSIQNGFASTAYATQAQTNALSRDLQNQTQTIIDKISAMEANAQQDKINTLTAQLTAANSRAERQAELQPIIKELNEIRCAQPATTTVQYPQLTTIPTTLYNYMQGGYGYNTGFWN